MTATTVPQATGYDRSAATYDDNGNLLPTTYVLKNCPERYNGPRYTGWLAQVSEEALDLHFNGDHEDPACCSQDEPCNLAAFQMLALSKHGHLTPDSRATEDDMTIRRPSNPTGASKGGRTYSNQATDKQVELINRLAGELVNGTTEDSKENIVGGIAFDYLDDVVPGNKLTKKVASSLIDKMMPLAKALAASRRREEAKHAAAKLEAGALYRYEGQVYRVQQSRDTGRMYAVKLELPENGRKKLVTTYAPGAIRNLTAEMKLGLGEVQAYGREFGFCGICSKLLTRQESIERGIGPVCAGKY